MHSNEMTEEVSRLKALHEWLSPMKPVRHTMMLRGRTTELASVLDAIQYNSQIPFIYGPRGVGKTSLARSATEQVGKTENGAVYVPCGPRASALELMTQAAIEMADVLIRTQSEALKLDSAELNISWSPGLKFVWRRAHSEQPNIANVNDAVRILRDLSDKLAHEPPVIVVFDELEEMNPDSKNDLAFFIKQIGDQDFAVRFVFVGIAENIEQLVGAHESAPRYLHNVELRPLPAQGLIDIVEGGAKSVGIEVPEEIVFRIAQIGNGYPHFAHLIGLHILQNAVRAGESRVSAETYSNGIEEAIRGSMEELTRSYDAATQRATNVYKYVAWTFADIEEVDVRSDSVWERYQQLYARFKHLNWYHATKEEVADAIQRLRLDDYGGLLMHTPKTYGDNQRRYRHHRFAHNLMKGHVRLRAAHENIDLGRASTSRELSL